MSPSIKKVDDQVSKLISAGQVITALKSAVKELVENSLDAGATDIQVVIHNWGVTGFTVEDNGCGIPPDALGILVEHRATSKIQPGSKAVELMGDVEDGSATLGFRGEALHCLGTLAAVAIETVHEGAQGQGPTSLYGRRPEFASARPNTKCGTTVSVSELFVRYPVRRQQFEASKKSQLDETASELKRLAATNPQVRFYCQHWIAGKAPTIITATNGTGDLLKTVAVVYGGRLAAEMAVLSEKTLPCGCVSGVVSQVASPRSTTEAQIIVINGRIVEHAKMKKGLIDCYRSLLPVTDARKTPAFVIFVTLEGVTVDCNLTPDKRQVLLGDEGAAQQVLQAVEAEWKAQREAVPVACIGAPSSRGSGGGGGAGRSVETFLPITLIAAPARSAASGDSQTPPPHTGTKRARDADSEGDVMVIEDAVAEEPRFAVSSIATFDAQAWDSGEGNACCGDCSNVGPGCGGGGIATESIQHQKDEMLGSLLTKTALSHDTEVLGQFNNGFIMCKCQGRLFIVDQHAADEKYNFERLMRTIKLTPQPLVQPVLVPMEEAEAALALGHEDELKNHGFTIRDARPNGILVTGLAPLQYDVVTPHDIVELTQQLVTYGSIVKRLKAVWHSCATKACRTSIMIGRTLDFPTMNKVVKHLGELENPWSCPHGRPTLRLLGKVED